MKVHRPLAYLACPYTHPDQSVIEQRVKIVNDVAGLLIKSGIVLFSPISHSHEIAKQCKLPCDWDFWANYDHAVLSVCHTLYVLMLDGWHQSAGVTAEIKFAKSANMGIVYLDPRPHTKTIVDYDAMFKASI